MHQLEVLFILRRRARRDFVNPLADVPVIRPPEFRERIEKMIVPCHARRRHKSPHGKRIHQRIVQFLMLKRGFRGNFALAARILLRSAARQRLRFRKRQLDDVHAQVIFCPSADPRFRVHCPAQVIVQVSSLRHVPQEVPKLQRVLSRRFEVGFRALLQACRRGRRRRRFALTTSRQRDEQRQNENAAPSAQGQSSRKIGFPVFHAKDLPEVAA